MRLLILQTAAYGRLQAIERKEGDEIDAIEFGDIDYIADCVKSGHIQIVDANDPPEGATKLPTAPIMSGEGDNLGKIDITDAALALASANDIPIAGVVGTGKNGKIVIADIQSILESRSEG